MEVAAYHCPNPDCSRSKGKGGGVILGWELFKAHLNDHLLAGEVMEYVIRVFDLKVCVCGKVVGAHVRAHEACFQYWESTGDAEVLPKAPDLKDLPSLEEVMGTKVRMLRSVPTKLHRAWSKALKATLTRVYTENTPEAWILLMMLAKACLVHGASRRRIRTS
eukprot:TRINITY_DN3038_c0_g1_i1.p1 TRINITY_DN3038_c0_g1~~TRINITY_DN3038_c0_g1_i1.p1  ORF type:complete len:176 (-),score=52.09 TRINITY_DN3038_c0_g1_i1:317-805(-)